MSGSAVPGYCLAKPSSYLQQTGKETNMQKKQGEQRTNSK